jgi:hypothetical protein
LEKRGVTFLAAFTVAAGVLLLVVGLCSYLVLPGLIESRLETSLQGRYGLQGKPAVEVSSGFPPGLLLGRIDRIQVQIDRLKREGLLLRNVRIDLRDVSMLSLLRGDLEGETRAASLRAEVPKDSINEYLGENNPGFRGEIDVLPQGLVYRNSDALFGLPVNVSLNLRVAGPHTIEVIPQEATVGGVSLPPFFTRSLAAGGRTLDLGELPFGSGLVSAEPSEDALVVRAEK